jgi:hypothetical protein
MPHGRYSHRCHTATGRGLPPGRVAHAPEPAANLERLRRAPYRVIFSSCDSGVLAPAGADELLGLAHTLAPRGTAGIVASVVPVNAAAGPARLMSRRVRAAFSKGACIKPGIASSVRVRATQWGAKGLALGDAWCPESLVRPGPAGGG